MLHHDEDSLQFKNFLSDIKKPTQEWVFWLCLIKLIQFQQIHNDGQIDL